MEDKMEDTIDKKDFDIPQALCLQCRLLIEERKKGFVLIHTRNSKKSAASFFALFSALGFKYRRVSERRFLRLYKRKYKTSCIQNEECVN